MLNHCEEWQYLARQLSLEIVSPFSFQIGNGQIIECEVLLKNFGSPIGMLIFTKYPEIEDLFDEMDKLGFVFTSYDPPSTLDSVDPDSYIEMLNEWGWCGNDAAKPKWIRS